MCRWQCDTVYILLLADITDDGQGILASMHEVGGMGWDKAPISDQC